MSSLIGRGLNTLLKYGRRVPVVQSAVDVVTDPRTYSMISSQADDVLQRIIPGKFRGVGIQNAPMSLLGGVDDISRMAPGGAKEAARNQLQRNFNMAGRLDDAVRPTGGQAATGALRAPSVPSATRSFDRVYPRGARATSGPSIPNLSSTFQGPALPGGSRGLLNKAVRGAGLPIVGGVVDAGLRINSGENPIDAVGRATFGTLGGIGGGLGAGLLGVPTGPGALVTGLAGGYAGYEGGTRLYDSLKPGFMDYIQNPARSGGMPGADALGAPLNPTRPANFPLPESTTRDSRPRQGEGLDMEFIRQESAKAEAAKKTKEQKASPVGPSPEYQLDPTPRVQPPAPGDPPSTPTVIPGTPIPQTPSVAARPYAPADNAGNVGATYGNGTSTMPNANVQNTVLPPNAEQILQADPMMIYQQARQASMGQGQSSMNKVRDLGLAIHRQTNPMLYATDNALPGSMTAKDENDALTEIEPSQIDQALLGIYTGNNPVLDPNKFLELQLQGRVAR